MINRKSDGIVSLVIALSVLLVACGPAIPSKGGPGPTTLSPAAGSLPSFAASMATPSAMPPAQVTATPATYGPEALDFPPAINPLSGLPVTDPSLLKIPIVLVSISHFPATARPQAGLSFAPFVYEFSITGGESRFLAAFYAEWPRVETPVQGVCGVRNGVFVQTGALIAGRVWLDINADGRLDPGEEGIPGECVALLDAQGTTISQTTTDTNGYYGFNVDGTGVYRVHFDRPAYLDFSPADVGEDNADSDAAPASGDTPLLSGGGSQPWINAGLYTNESYPAPTPDPKLAPLPAVGPVRSGRLLYAHIGAFYQNSCLIYAFASPEVLERLPHCAFVAHETSGGGEMLSIARMQAVAEDNMRHTASHPFNYTSNVYSDLVPSGAAPASDLEVFFGNLNQSGWKYDPLYRSYLRYVDTADPKARGVLHPDVDRLTGRQLHFENVIVIMADTDVISRTDIDIHLDEGNGGPAYAFRDGQMYSIEWSTRAGEYERTSGLRRPISFLEKSGTPYPLKPGHTWVVIVTPFSFFGSIGPGIFQVKYGPPAGEAQ